MKIGYPCINLSLDCKNNRTFRLKSYSEERLIKTVENNLNCLLEILKFNLKHNLMFFRITSDLVPFASHPVCQFDWQNHFKSKFREIGSLIKLNNMRISMHPDQFTLINSVKTDVFQRSVDELTYHAQILDLMQLDTSAKIQIHVGGVYGDKDKSIKRFIKRHKELDDAIKRRLVIENDDRNYNLRDCMKIRSEINIPVLFDVFHHQIYNCGESLSEAFSIFSGTWKKKDGIPMMDYSLQEKGERKGKHAESIDPEDFQSFVKATKEFDLDIMLEIKDKEISALKALEILQSLDKV
jgi:UV DNA damage endonuclease